MTDLIHPVLTDNNRGFWEGCAAGELRVQSCVACGHLRYPLAPWCPECLDERWEWQALSGRATVLSKLVFHQSYHPAWKDRIPYNVVLVQLDEGPRMISNVVPLSNDDFVVGDAVTVEFEIEGEFSIPRFRLLG
jgi:uncharacterized OB-fold protein